MLKKLGLIALSSLLVLPVFASAETISIVEDPEYPGYYLPETFVLSTAKDFTSSDITNYSFIEDADYCYVNLNNENSSDYRCMFYVNSDGVSMDGDSNCSFDAGETIYINRSDGEVCASLTLNIGVGSDTPENSDVIGSFGTDLSGLVGNLVSSFGGILPTLILYGLGICMFFVFRSVVKKLSVSVFGIGKSKSYDNSRLEREKARKEKLYRENEQQKDMYFSMYKKDL